MSTAGPWATIETAIGDVGLEPHRIEVQQDDDQWVVYLVGHDLHDHMTAHTLVILVKWGDGEGTWKDMGVDMHPYYYGCSPRFLAYAAGSSGRTQGARDWVAACRDRQKGRKWARAVSIDTIRYKAQKERNRR